MLSVVLFVDKHSFAFVILGVVPQLQRNIMFFFFSMKSQCEVHNYFHTYSWGSKTCNAVDYVTMPLDAPQSCVPVAS